MTASAAHFSIALLCSRSVPDATGWSAQQDKDPTVGGTASVPSRPMTGACTRAAVSYSCLSLAWHSCVHMPLKRSVTAQVVVDDLHGLQLCSALSAATANCWVTATLLQLYSNSIHCIQSSGHNRQSYRRQVQHLLLAVGTASAAIQLSAVSYQSLGGVFLLTWVEERGILTNIGHNTGCKSGYNEHELQTQPGAHSVCVAGHHPNSLG